MARRKSTIEVQVGRFGRPVVNIQLDNGSTVEDALDEADLTAKKSETVTLNGDAVEMDEELEDNDIILLTRNVQGGN